MSTRKIKLAYFKWIIFSIILILSIDSALACDSSLLIPNSAQSNRSSNHNHSHNLRLFIQEQYTSLKINDSSAANSIKNGELVKGFLTNQINLSYDLDESFSLMLSVPYIVRSFDEIKNFSKDSKIDSGLGDISALGYFSDTLYSSEKFSAFYSFYGGVKTPTGDSGSIETGSQVNPSVKHHVVPSSSGAGRILTFGTGSYDFPLGAGVYLESNKFLLPISFQYTFKTEGSFDYKFADDGIFYVAPGFNFYKSEDFSSSLHYMVSGEYKNADRKDSKRVAESAYSNVFMGPSTMLRIGHQLGAELSYLFRTTEEDNAILAPENRIRFNVAYSF